MRRQTDIVLVQFMLHLTYHNKKENYFTVIWGIQNQMNKNVYQALLALMGITKIGKQLMEIDSGKFHMVFIFMGNFSVSFVF